jgi:F-type H+-transporting ATPase subunit b
VPQLDISTFTPQIIWLIITFGVLYLLMAKLALPRIGSILEQRQNRIEDNLAMAQNLKRESEVDAESYETAILEAREQARTSTQLAIKEMSEESQRRQSELNDRLVNEVKSAEERIAQARKKAMSNISEMAEDIVLDAAESLIGITPNKDTIKNAVSAKLKGHPEG